jgi:hypothetical protein
MCICEPYSTINAELQPALHLGLPLEHPFDLGLHLCRGFARVHGAELHHSFEQLPAVTKMQSEALTQV